MSDAKLTTMPNRFRLAELIALALLGCAALCWMKGLYVYLAAADTAPYAIKCGLAGLAMAVGGLALILKAKEEKQANASRDTE